MKQVVAVWLIATAVAACNDGDAQDRAEGAKQHPDAGAQRFVGADCADVAWMDMEGSECGWVNVAADHMRDDQTLDLGIVILKATGADSAEDPVLILAGGPGQSGIEAIARRPIEVLPLWRERRDVILFDQRGTGVSGPDLDCPEYYVQYATNLVKASTATEDNDRLVTALEACHQRLVGEDIDLTIYTSAQSAHDVADIMSSLGYPSYNLVGVSYGARLALTVMRDFPSQVRSVVLDSPQPIEANLIYPRDAEYAFKQLFAACDADGRCAEKYPDLEQTLLERVAEFDAHPVELGSSKVVVTGTRYLLGLAQTMAATDTIPSLPRLITEPVTTLPGWGSSIGLGIKEGMSYSVLCSEEYPFYKENYDEEVASVAEPYRSLNQGDFQTMGACKYWSTRAPDRKDPARSALPTLILSGSLDPILPHYYAEQIAENLPNAQILHFEGFGHGVIRAKSGESRVPRCAQRISQAFLDAPTSPVDTACQNDIPPVDWVSAPQSGS